MIFKAKGRLISVNEFEIYGSVLGLFLETRLSTIEYSGIREPQRNKIIDEIEESLIANYKYINIDEIVKRFEVEPYKKPEPTEAQKKAVGGLTLNPEGGELSL